MIKLNESPIEFGGQKRNFLVLFINFVKIKKLFLNFGLGIISFLN